MESYVVDAAPESTAIAHPWRRYLARGLDISLYSLIWTAVQYLLLRWQPGDGLLVSILISYIDFSLMLIIEPVLLSTIGTTPGKLIFGLKLAREDGSRLTYSEALGRTFGVFARGFGFGIPIYNIVRLIKCRKASLAGEPMEWDCGLSYTLVLTNPLRALAFALAEAAVLLATFFVIISGQLPLNRAPLTKEAYIANINDVLSRPNMYYGRRMDEAGAWYRGEASNNMWFIQEREMPNHIITLEDGVVTGVGYEITVTDDEPFTFPGGLQKLYMAIAFFGAEKGVSAATLAFNSELQEMIKSYKPFDISLFGVRMMQETEFDGYYLISDYLAPVEGAASRRFKTTFSMSLE